MAHVTGHFDESALLARPTAELGRLGSRSLMLGAVGAVGVALGLVTFGDHFADAFWQSYLIGYIFWIGITLGALGILMIQHLTGGAWTMISRRVLEAATRTLPLMAVLFLPLFFNMERLYPWVNPDPNDESMAHVLYLKSIGVDIDVPLRSPAAVEATIYFTVAEALTNVARHSGAEQAHVVVRTPMRGVAVRAAGARPVELPNVPRQPALVIAAA